MSVVSIPILERAQASDLPALNKLLTEVGLPQDGLAQHLTTAIVARHSDDLVGSAALEVYGSSALLRSVAVLPTAQSQGLGRRLVEAALALAKEQQLARVYLLTETAADYFPRFGFKTIARHEVDPAVQQSVEFTSACPASAIVMEKSMSNP